MSGSIPEINFPAIDKRERRLVRAIAVLVGLLVALVGVVCFLTIRGDSRDRQTACSQAITVRFLAATIRTLNIPLEDREPIVGRLVENAETIDTRLFTGSDPCSITLPDVFHP